MNNETFVSNHTQQISATSINMSPPDLSGQIGMPGEVIGQGARDLVANVSSSKEIQNNAFNLPSTTEQLPPNLGLSHKKMASIPSQPEAMTPSQRARPAEALTGEIAHVADRPVSALPMMQITSPSLRVVLPSLRPSPPRQTQTDTPLGGLHCRKDREQSSAAASSDSGDSFNPGYSIVYSPTLEHDQCIDGQYFGLTDSEPVDHRSQLPESTRSSIPNTALPIYRAGYAPFSTAATPVADPKNTTGADSVTFAPWTDIQQHGEERGATITLPTPELRRILDKYGRQLADRLAYHYANAPPEKCLSKLRSQAMTTMEDVGFDILGLTAKNAGAMTAARGRGPEPQAVTTTKFKDGTTTMGPHNVPSPKTRKSYTTSTAAECPPTTTKLTAQPTKPYISQQNIETPYRTKVSGAPSPIQRNGPLTSPGSIPIRTYASSTMSRTLTTQADAKPPEASRAAAGGSQSLPAMPTRPARPDTKKALSDFVNSHTEGNLSVVTPHELYLEEYVAHDHAIRLDMVGSPWGNRGRILFENRDSRQQETVYYELGHSARSHVSPTYGDIIIPRVNQNVRIFLHALRMMLCRKTELLASWKAANQSRAMRTSGLDGHPGSAWEGELHFLSLVPAPDGGDKLSVVTGGDGEATVSRRLILARCPKQLKDARAGLGTTYIDVTTGKQTSKQPDDIVLPETESTLRILLTFAQSVHGPAKGGKIPGVLPRDILREISMRPKRERSPDPRREDSRGGGRDFKRARTRR